SAQRLPLTMALSRLGGQPVSVQAPATSKISIGLRWMGRCNLVAGLSESMALEIVRWRVETTLRSVERSHHDLSRSGIAASRCESGQTCANWLSVVIRENLVRSGVVAVTSTE